MRNFSSILFGLVFIFHVSSGHPDGHSEPSGVQKEILVQTSESWDGAPLPDYPEQRPEISVVRFIVPPHTQLPWHRHPMINAGVLVRGSLTVVSENGDEKTLEQGDAIVELVDTLHYGRNDGDVPAEIVVIYAGVKGEPLAILSEE